MSRPTSTFAIRLLPSLQDFAFLMPIVFLFARMEGARTLLGDGDTGWHIRTGDWILANGRVPTHDLFSFTRPGQEWFAWEWLWDVLFSLIHRAGGLAAVVVVNMFLIAFTFLLLYRLAARHANPLAALVVTMVAAASSSIHWLARPHLFTLLFAVVFYGLLERAAEGRTRFLWLLPALTVPWTNLHAGFFVGIILIGAFAAGELAGALLEPEPDRRREAWGRARLYLASAAGCFAASFINPYSYRLHSHVLAYLTDSYQGENINEFLTLSFRHPLALFFEVMLMSGVLAAAWHFRRGNRRAAVLVVVWGHGALLAARNIPIYAIVAAPLIAEALQHGLDRLPAHPAAAWVRRAGAGFLRIASVFAEMEAIGRWRLASVFGLGLVAALAFAPAPPQSFRPEFDRQTYPAAALEKMNFGPESRIFTNDEWGDYLIYRLYPKNRVFVDGRSDFYGRQFEEEYQDVIRVKHNWERILGDFGIDTILLPVGASLAGALKESSRWRVAYDDGITLVFRPGRDSRTGGAQISAGPGGGMGRDREITKTEVRDQPITESKSKTTT